MVNPNGAHAVACGVDAEVEIEVDGHVGYYCAGMNKLATVRVHGNAGPGLAENMMSGSVVLSGNASQSAGATGRGGLLVDPRRCRRPLRDLDEGDRHRRRGSVGHLAAFMAQTGRLVVCGDVGEALGDSIYEARLYVRGEIASLGADCVEKDLRDEHARSSRELLERAGIDGDPPTTSGGTGPRGASTTSTSTTLIDGLAPRPTRVVPLRPQRDRRDPARGPRGIYDIRGFGAKRRLPHFDDLLLLGASVSRYPLEGYRERCDTTSRSGRGTRRIRSS